MGSGLILMVKYPRTGDVKRRLARSMGEENAAEIYRRFVLDLIDTFKGQEFELLIGFHPPQDLHLIESWLGRGWKKIPQNGGDLGEKQASLLNAAFKLGYSRACVVASDIPDIPLDRVTSAFACLLKYGCVIGPSTDGGYNLIGFRRDSFLETPFLHMSWGGPTVAREMKERLGRHGISWTEILPWPDVDDEDDLRALIDRHREDTGPRRTMELLRQLKLL